MGRKQSRTNFSKKNKFSSNFPNQTNNIPKKVPSNTSPSVGQTLKEGATLGLGMGMGSAVAHTTFDAMF